MIEFNKVEEEILKFWNDKKIYEKVKKKNLKGKNFYFLQGPPYTSGRLHIGHAWNNSLKDIVLRYKRMQGMNVWDRAGYDMHGLPTENAVQKKLGIKDKLGIEDYGVEKFIQECKKFASENAKVMDKDLERLGVWMDFKNAYWPIKNNFIEGEWWLIKKAFEQKRLYKGNKIMHWCSSCETSLAKHELEYENIEDNSIYLKFKTKDGRYLIVWTTTPWTISFNLAIMANPDFEYSEVLVDSEKWIIASKLVDKVMKLVDKKYKILKKFKGKQLEGLKYEHPFKNISFPKSKNVHTVILSKDFVTLDAGTGLVHSAPGCGPEDYEACKPYKINAFNEIDEQGVFKNMGEFSNLVAKKDDDKFISELQKRGALIAQEKVSHEYAHCWRCHHPVVFRATEQWFLKIEDLIPKLLGFNKKVKWQPGFTSDNYNSWVSNLKDNGITRQRYWGCPAPIWTCECGQIEVIGSVAELKKKTLSKIPEDLHKPWIDSVKIKCKCGKIMERVPDVIDVWIDSGTTSWNCLDYPENKDNIKLWPADFILEATEQIKLWFSMLQMCSAIVFGKSSYKSVYCHGMILDYQGTKMSKSLGNIISPYEVVDKYSADLLRYYMCETKAGENINFNWEEVKQKQRNLLVLWNLHRLLIDMKNNKETGKAEIDEKYITSRLNSSIKKITELFESYRVDETITEIEKLYLDLSRVYIQFNRERSDEKVVFDSLKEVYLACLKMFSVICPFVTEKIWQELRLAGIVKEESVHLCDWPKSKGKADEKLEKEFIGILKIIELGLAARDKAQIGLRWPLAKAIIFSEEKIDTRLEEIIARQLNVKKVQVSKGKLKVELDLKMTEELENEGYARELARSVQAERKKAGLVKKDLIEIVIVVKNEMIDRLKTQIEFLKARTNAKKLSIAYSEDKKLKFSGKSKIKDRDFEIHFSKV